MSKRMISSMVVLSFISTMFNVNLVATAVDDRSFYFDADKTEMTVNESIDVPEHAFAEILVLPDDFKREDLSWENIDEHKMLIKRVRTRGGVVSDTMLFDDRGALESGEYVVYVECGEYINRNIFIIPNSELTDAVSEANSSGYISSAEFGANEKVFAANKVIINSLVANAKTAKGFTNQSFLDTYLQSEGVAQLKNGGITIDDFADLYNSYFGEVFTGYDEWTESKKQTYSSVIKAYSLNGLTPEQLVNKAKFVTDCRTAADSYALSDIVIEYINKNELSSGSYNSLNDYYKNKVFVDLYEKIGQINSAEEIYSRFISFCNDYNKTSSTVTGSSGGETSSAYIPIAAVPTQVPSSVQTPQPNQEFTDTTGHWAEEYIKECYSLGLVSGFDDNTFRPETNITRAETAVIISRLLGLAGSVGNDFYDVAADAWYNPYITAAHKAGIVLGDEGYFYPNNNITRQDMAVMLMRLIRSRGMELSGDVIFDDDSDISDYAKDSISILAANNIITGDNGLFSPKRNLTRAEAAALIYRVRSLIFNIPDSISPVDTSATGSLNSEYLQEARALLNALTDNEVFKDINTTNVTRGDFISAIVSVLGGSEKASSSVFGDVPIGSKYADDAEKALQLGIIEKSDQLIPDEEIPFNEAVAMVTKAMGFSYFAEQQGGYPQGYLKIAQERKLLKNVKSAEFLSYMDMNILLYNMLQGEIPVIEYRTDNDFSYKYDGGTTLLSSLYDIKSVKGIITRNFVTSYDMQYSYSKDSNIVAVDGKRYSSDINIDRYFGMNCIVFYRDDGTDSIVSVYPVKNRELTVDLEDIFDFNDTVLKYTDAITGREKRVRTVASYLEVYNGKVTYSDRNHITDNTGILRLVDNNNDGIYDVLFISHYTYLKVKNLDVNDRIIEDENSSKYNLNVDEDIVALSLSDHTGKEMEIHEIRPGDVLAILKSLDGTVAAITVLGSPVTVTAGFISENHITVDGTEYTISDYAAEFGKNLAVGVGLSLYINNKEIAYLDLGEQQYQYGYVTKLIIDESGENYLMRTFSTDGKFHLFQFAKKLKFDGITYNSGIVYETFNKNFAPQLIRYKLNSVGALVAIDTAEVVDMSTASKNPWADKQNEDNKLKQYLYAPTSFAYRSSKAFGMSFNGAGATVFMLPVTTASNTEIDVNNSSEFEIVDISQIATGITYSYFDVYDVDENGSAAVFVSRKVETANSPYSFYGGYRLKMVSGMVASVQEAVSESDDEGHNIELWSNGKFYQYFMPNSVLCPMAEGESLEPGDIIRYRVQDNEIETCILDFNASALEGNERYDNRSAGLNVGDVSVTYNVGKLYSHDGNFCTHSNTFDGEKYDFTPCSLFNTQVNSTYICRFDSTTKTVRPIQLNDLRDYRVYGDNADYVVIKQSNLTASCMYVYGKGDGN